MSNVVTHRLTVWLSCAAIGALVLCIPGNAEAQVVPYKSSGDDAYFHPATGEYGGSGHATHLGKHDFFGTVELLEVSPDGLFATWQSTDHVNIAANGDEIWFDASGEVTFIPLDDTFTTFTAVWEADFVPVGGTGRFANVQQADEPLTVIAVNDPFSFDEPVWTFSWELTGEIDLGNKP